MSAGSAKRRGMAAAMAEKIARETDGGAKMVEFATRVLDDDMASMVDRRWAAEFLSDRGAGKAPQIVETEHTLHLSDGTDLGALSDAELEQLEGRLRSLPPATEAEIVIDLVGEDTQA